MRERNPDLFRRRVIIPIPLRDEDGAVGSLRLTDDPTPPPANRRPTLPYGECPAVTLDRLPSHRPRLRWRPTA